MKSLEKQLQKARPRLRVVSPLASWIVTVMGWFNIILGLTFILSIDDTRFNAPLFIVNQVVNFDVWGIIFIVIGIVKLYSIHVNNWNLARKSLFIGVSVKAAWMVALTIRTFVSPGTAFLNLLWITIALIQMGAYIWFMPPSIQTNIQDKK